jgi:hypothetical protein
MPLQLKKQHTKVNPKPSTGKKKNYKIALIFSVSTTLLSHSCQTELSIFPDDGHIGSTGMRFLFQDPLIIIIIIIIPEFV